MGNEREKNAMNKRFDIQKLQLPIPGRLAPQAEMATGNALRPDALAEFLANGLKDTGAIEAWLTEQASAMSDLPRQPEQEQLSPRQRIYDQYFNVIRHGGSIASVTFALAQVMGEVSRELHVGSDLGEPDMNRLLDGLTAVLEAVGER